MILISHRGCSSNCPENTIAAFERSFLEKMDWIELDIALDKEKNIVVIHDDTVDRTSNGSGPVRNFTLKELRILDFGSWKSSNFAGQRIPLLEEVLDLFGDKLNINIEIKSGFFELVQSKTCIETQMLEMLRNKNLLSKTLISSFDKRYLNRLCQLEPMLRLAVLIENESIAEAKACVSEFPCYSIHISKERLSKKWVDLAKQQNLKLFVYTVNSKSYYNKCLNFGVDGIFTDMTPSDFFDNA